MLWGPGVGWKKLYHKSIGTAATTDTFTVPGTGEAWSALRLTARIHNSHASVTCNVFLRPNNLTSDQVNSYWGVFGGTFADVQSTNMQIDREVDAGDSVIIEGIFYPKTGDKRRYSGRCYGTGDAGVDYGTINDATWTDTTTAVTSLVIVADQTGGLGVGSYIIWEGLS